MVAGKVKQRSALKLKQLTLFVTNLEESEDWDKALFNQKDILINKPY